MAYTKNHASWADSPATTTPITAAKLDNIENGLVTAAAEADDALAGKIPALTLDNNLTPALPAANKVTMFGRKVAGRMLPAFIGPSGLDSALQSNIYRNKVGLWSPAGGTGTSNIGFGVSTTGTATGANIAGSGTAQSWMRRMELLVTTAATTAVAGVRSTNTFGARGDSTAAAMGMGGFFVVIRWGPATGMSNANRRAFAGVRADLNAPTDVAPSSQFNCLGMSYESGDTNMQFIHNDASGAATKVDLGASFPKPTVDRDKVYEIALFCPPNASTVDWQVTDVGTNAIATGTASTNLPVNTTPLGCVVYSSVGGTSAVTGVSVVTMYYETDN